MIKNKHCYSIPDMKIWVVAPNVSILQSSGNGTFNTIPFTSDESDEDIFSFGTGE